MLIGALSEKTRQIDFPSAQCWKNAFVSGAIFTRVSQKNRQKLHDNRLSAR